MKKYFAFLLALTMLCSLTACGGKEENVPAPAPETAPPVTAPVLENTDVGNSEEPPAAEPEPNPAPEIAEAEPSLMEIAESFVGGEASELIAAIGEPQSADYASSCLGSGEDGILEYADFLVYTYREGDSERVDTVLAK